MIAILKIEKEEARVICVFFEEIGAMDIASFFDDAIGHSMMGIDLLESQLE